MKTDAASLDRPYTALQKWSAQPKSVCGANERTISRDSGHNFFLQ